MCATNTGNSLTYKKAATNLYILTLVGVCLVEMVIKIVCMKITGLLVEIMGFQFWRCSLRLSLFSCVRSPFMLDVVLVYPESNACL